MAKPKFKYIYIGRIVNKSGEKDGEKWESSALELGERFYMKGEKKGELIPPVKLSKSQKEKLDELIFSEQLYLFNPPDTAPEFVKKYVAIKASALGESEDEQQEEKPKSKKRPKNDDL